MFGSNYAANFGLPQFPWTGLDPQGGLYQPNFSGMNQGQPVPGVPAPPGEQPPPTGGMGAGPSANPSVDALRSGGPLAQAITGNPLGFVGELTSEVRADPLGAFNSLLGRPSGGPSGGAGGLTGAAGQPSGFTRSARDAPLT